MATHVMEPLHFEHRRVGFDTTLEIHVIALFDVVHIQVESRRQGEPRRVCRRDEEHDEG